VRRVLPHTIGSEIFSARGGCAASYFATLGARRIVAGENDSLSIPRMNVTDESAQRR
jgi:hypothetical protein